jgi:adenylate cyclase
MDAERVSLRTATEDAAPEEGGTPLQLAGRPVSELVAEVVEPPVRLVKLIGDAAMLVGTETAPVLEAVLALVEAAENEGEDFPLLRGGVATGNAIARAGDWYGHPVNLASRITERARPGSVLAAKPVRDELRDAYSWSFAGAKRLKGIEDDVPLYRCRRDGGAE